jgi:signal transduction histidine kinase
MRERAAKIGARLDIWSRPGAGTEIELRLAADVAYIPEPRRRRSAKGEGDSN